MPEPSPLELYRTAASLPPDEARIFVAESSCSDEAKQEVLAHLGLSASAVNADDTQRWRAGSTIGHYIITGELGRGGMGVVCSARDISLDREVALKFLSRESIQDRAVELLEHEARTASSLNHPNIVTVHEVIRSRMDVAIVMEKVDGVSVRRVIETAPSLARVIDIGRQVASAVAAAHSKGILHRDLKPDNIMVREDGYVKVLDFGLARHTIEGAPGSGSTSRSWAGSLRYMSPEQARGEPLTPASDVYSLGLMLYEMCTGAHPFPANSALATAHAIATGDAQEMIAKNAAIPRGLSALVSTMLQRDASARPSAREVAETLTTVIAEPPAAPDKPVASSARKGTRVLTIGAAAVLALLLLYLGFDRTPERAVSILDTQVDLGTPAALEEEGFAISPDGRTLLFVAGGSLHYVSLAGGPAKRWTGAEQGRFPFWSPDGKEAGFYWNKKLWRKSFPDGPMREICDAAEPVGASWGTRGTIVFSSGDGPIRSVPASGGTPTSVTTLGANLFDASPVFLPDGSRFLFYRADERRRGSLMLGTTDGTRTASTLAAATTSAVYLPRPQSSDGVLVYGHERKLIAHPFNASKTSFAGAPFLISEQAREFRRRVIPASASVGGVLVYAEEEDKADQPKIFDRRGQLIARLGPRREYIRAVPSPDFKKIAVVSRDSASMLFNLEIVDRRTGNSHRLRGPDRMLLPIWSRDGKRIAYTSRSGDFQPVLNIQRLSPESSPESIPLLSHTSWSQDWSPDGRILLVTAETSGTDRSIWALPLDRSRLPSQLVRTPGKNDEQHWSPDGRFIAYQSNESGHMEIYVIPFPPDGRRWKVSQGGGQEPRWRADGKELFYLSLDYALMSVKTSTAGGFSFGPPATLFGGRSGEPALMVWHAEPSPDGQQFVILTGARSRGSALRLRLNWWARAETPVSAPSR